MGGKGANHRRATRALGTRHEIGSIYAAADIYLDSYPFSSLTSMLEAGQRGLPLLSLGSADPQLDVLGFDDPATDGLPIRFRAEDEYLQELGISYVIPPGGPRLGNASSTRCRSMGVLRGSDA